ncbi:MAG: hypothetical protein IT373_21485 [Polyangiaceae bacterium]|nr:hypothetical protein [Polyangiaceae bacterium]
MHALRSPLSAASLCLLLAAPAALSLAACESSDETEAPQPTLTGAAGVTITEVSIYQGVKRTLAQNGQPVAANVPLVAERTALVRVFYGAAPEAVGQSLVGRLEITGRAPLDVPFTAAAASLEHDLATTLNFDVPAEWMTDPFGYRVSILSLGLADNAAAHYPVGAPEILPVEGPRNVFRVVIAPFEYNADGSGRVPDTSPAAVESFRQRLLQLYPVSNVEVTVRAPEPWNQAIQPDGTGWQEVGIRLFGIRNNEAPSQDYYYFGLFDPAASFFQFCGMGCLLGVTLLNDTPADVGNPQLRLGLGVGFPEYARDTMAHELGHAHGREHVNCGQGLDPQSIDPNYPYSGQTIGAWGFDIVNHALVDPAVYSDIMGYCDTQWISDYNFAALLARGKNVNLPRYHEPVARVRYELVAVGADSAAFAEPAELAPLAGPTVRAKLRRAGGSEVEVGAHYFAYDHLPGGWLLFPAGEERVVRAELALGGRTFVAARP